jgi:hypothetical protein
MKNLYQNNTKNEISTTSNLERPKKQRETILEVCFSYLLGVATVVLYIVRDDEGRERSDTSPEFVRFVSHISSMYVVHLQVHQLKSWLANSFFLHSESLYLFFAIERYLLRHVFL